MAKEVFNEAERFLIQHWFDTGELEESIEETRIKYQALCEKVAETVREQHDDLDMQTVEVTRVSGPAGMKAGVIKLSKKLWTKGKHYWTGFWMENLRLEYLADEDEPQPLVYLWVNAEEAGLEQNKVERVIREAIEEVLTPVELTGVTTVIGDDYFLEIQFATKQQLIDMLAKGETDRFVETLAKPFDLLAKLMPAIDQIFTAVKPQRKSS